VNSSVPLAKLQVAVWGPSGITIFPRDVNAVMPGGDIYRDEEIPFTVPVPSVVETQAAYAGVAPLWIECVRVQPDRGEHTDFPLTAALVALAGAAGLTVGVWRRRQNGAHWWALLAAKISFIGSAAIAIEPIHFLGLNESWWLALWISALLSVGGLMLAAIHRITKQPDSLAVVADVVSDAIVVAAILCTWPQLNLFAVAALAAAAWICKLALMAFSLARAQQGRIVRAAVLIAAYAYVGLLPWHHFYVPSGDQPSYLVETLSLIRHGTVNTWQVIENEEYREFAPSVPKSSLEIDTLKVNGVSGFPARDLGVSLFSIPGYLLAKLDGAKLGMEIAAVLLAITVFTMVRQLAVDPVAATLAWVAVCFSVPMLHFSSMMFPELLGAFLTTAGLALLQAPFTKRVVVLIGLCVGLLPAMNARYWTLAASIAVLALLRIRETRQWSFLPLLALPPIILTAVEVAVNLAVYGIPLPNAGYYLILHGGNPSIYNNATPFARDFLVGWTGIWLDNRWGLLATAPVLMVAVAGFPALWLRCRQAAIQILAVFVPYFIAVASTTIWHASFPMGRYLIPVLPLLALPLAAIVNNRFRLLAGVLTGIGALTAIASLPALDSDYAPVRLAARCIDAFGFATALSLPSLSDTQKPESALIVGWVAAALTLAIMAHRASLGLRGRR
jgi:uncharacterized membrane protein